MSEIIESEKEKKLERELTSKAKKMSNIELKEALLEIRKKNLRENISSLETLDGKEELLLLLMEGIYSQELKNRELLEWALKEN